MSRSTPGAAIPTDPPVHRAVFGGAALADLQEWTSSVEAWPAGSHVWGHYAEQTDAGPAPCRTENVSACHPGFARIVRGPLLELAGEQLGSEAVDFKDKINYKYPGGAGFSPHQDVVAYPGVADVVSILVAVDECTTASGCLWIDAGVGEVLPTDDRGVIESSVGAALGWVAAELAPGDVLCIGGFAAHFSEANRSPAKRRVLVASYAPRAAAYTRSAYYAARERTMDGAPRTGRMRISTLEDFEGASLEDVPAVPASATSEREARCSHG